MYYLVSSVSFEGGFFEDIVKHSGMVDILKHELRIAFVIGYQNNCPYPENTFDKTPAKADVYHAEHIKIVHLPFENPPAPFDSVTAHLISGTLELNSFY